MLRLEFINFSRWVELLSTHHIKVEKVGLRLDTSNVNEGMRKNEKNAFVSIKLFCFVQLRQVQISINTWGKPSK